MIPPTTTDTDHAYIVEGHAEVWSPTRAFCAGAIFVALIAIPSCAIKAVADQRSGWIVTIGQPTDSETACALDLASLSNIVQSRTRLACRRVVLP